MLESALAPGGWKVWHHIVAVIFVIFYGSFEIIQGVASRAVNPWWWVNLITGILLLPRPRSATRAS